jgi:hypothetical protein
MINDQRAAALTHVELEGDQSVIPDRDYCIVFIFYPINPRLDSDVVVILSLPNTRTVVLYVLSVAAIRQLPQR